MTRPVLFSQYGPFCCDGPNLFGAYNLGDWKFCSCLLDFYVCSSHTCSCALENVGYVVNVVRLCMYSPDQVQISPQLVIFDSKLILRQLNELYSYWSVLCTDLSLVNVTSVVVFVTHEYTHAIFYNQGMYRNLNIFFSALYKHAVPLLTGGMTYHGEQYWR